jgi:putative Mg2+ transporter-C (MgtC) family protein
LAWGEPAGQGWSQVGELAVAFVLSATIGLERELKQRSAGVRTYTVVGLGAALFVLLSKYGFTDVLSEGRVVLDPSRVAAQIVSGVGFIGGGLIFVKRDAVRGLTTAASIWLVAAIGALAGAGLDLLALIGTIAYFMTVDLLPRVSRLVQRRLGAGYPRLRIQYVEQQGLLRRIIAVITQAGFSVQHFDTGPADAPVHRVPAQGGAGESPGDRTAEVNVLVGGRGDFGGLLTRLLDIDGVVVVDDGGNGEE